MSILNVEHLSHGFGDRAIFQDVSFRLLKGEHIGLVGANGEGKSTFMNIITGKLQPDEGKVEWSKRVRVGYLDQHSVLEKGMTIRDVLKSAFAFLFEMEEQMNQICDRMGEADEDEMNAMMEELGTIQDLLMAHDFYVIDAKVEEVARALGLNEIGLEKDVTDLSGGQRTKVLLGKLLLEKPDILLLDEPTNYLDVQHIEWLRRYLQEYENAFILISHDIPFLNSVINLIYHMENQRLDRYVGDYDKFQEVYAVKKSQLEAAYKRQQQEIAELEEDERKMFLEDLGLTESGLEKLIAASYHLLGLISYLTAGPTETRAWTIKVGTKAPQAAGKIHSDFERGFIKAEVVNYQDLLDCGTYTAAKEKGLVRMEGKEYVVKDGDVVLFRFNV